MKRKSNKTPTRSRKIVTAAPRRRFPAHLDVASPEEWRALKRTQWREVTQAFDRFSYGSAYVPATGALYTIERAARQVTEAIEAPDWIAW